MSTDSTAGIVLPAGFSYVVAALVSTVMLLNWQISVVAKHRRKSGIKYPQLYAELVEAETSEEAFLFNCAQRAHQSTLEYIPIILITTLVTGVKYPILAAAACTLWSLTHIIYTIGYTNGSPALCNWIILGQVLVVGLNIGSVYTAYTLVQAEKDMVFAGDWANWGLSF